MAASAFSGQQEQSQASAALPAGYRFAPHDHELILDYLVNKIMGFQLPSNAIKDFDFYEYDPNDLPTSDFKHGKNMNEAYYFTQKQQRYSNTEGTRRSKGGYWKAGEEWEICYEGELVGFMTIFAFYSIEGIEGVGKKSSWIMNEFRVNTGILPVEDDTITDKIERYVICRIRDKDNSRTDETTTHETEGLRS